MVTQMLNCAGDFSEDVWVFFHVSPASVVVVVVGTGASVVVVAGSTGFVVVVCIGPSVVVVVASGVSGFCGYQQV